MNLGDGLMFELENGKPKLILVKYGVESKNQNKIPPRSRPQKAILNSKQFPQGPVTEKPQRVQEKHTDTWRKYASDTAAVNHEEQADSYGPGKAKVKGNTDSRAKGAARVRSAKKSDCCKQTTTNGSSNVTKDTLKESLVCLTQEQFQQILSTINKASGPNLQDGSHTQTQTGPAEDSKEGSAVSGTVEQGTDEVFLLDGNNRNRSSQEKGREKKMLFNGTPPGLFNTLGEREREKEALEAKRAQWRRELDEQMALKQHQKASPEVMPDCEPWGRPSAGTSSIPSSGNVQTRVQEERVTRTALGTGDTYSRSREAQTYSSHRDLPAAIRSAFVLGEGTPVEHAFSVQKKEQQRRWLQDLDQQRQEAKLRRRQEKQDHNQAEDHERWAMHFDSLQKRLPLQPPPASDRGDPEPASSLSNQRSPSGALSAAWEGMSAFGGDSLGRASVDTTGGSTQKSSYLRTMTALLDPAQIEDRERKRLKQLEHQRAIEAQVEERRRQREREEGARQALEQEEERRVAKERQLLQQQYLLDTQRQRHKEELHLRKTEELFLSVQRAQEAAQKDKHLQRIRELARKGHDPSKLQRCLEGESASTHGLSRRDSPSPSPSLARVETTALRTDVLSTTSSRRDTAVQTEVNTAGQASEISTLADMDRAVHTPDVPIEYKPPSNTKRSRREARLAEWNQGTGKENVCVEPEEGDPYEAYARTDRSRHPRGGRRPEWNTHRPSKPFVPASERYPPGLRQHRQESRLRRQMELMTLVERNALSKTPHQEPSPPRSSNPSQNQRRHRNSPHKKDDNSQRSPTFSMAVHAESRVCSPPVPAIKHRLQQQSRQPPLPPTEEPVDTATRPPSSDYIPYVRTDEVYHLDPLAPLSRPSTHEPHPKTHAGVNSSRQATPLPQRDPLLHPELLKNRERQQAILKGLSELRQGLLQKQRELETGLNPLLQGQAGNPAPPFQHM